MFFAVLLAAFLFLAITLNGEPTVFYATQATGTTSVNLPGLTATFKLYINSAEGDASIDEGTANITANFTAADRTIYLYVNASGWTIQSGNGTVTNTSSFSVGVYNVTAWFPGDMNYSSYSATYFLTVSAPTPPTPPPGPGGGGGGTGGGAMLGPSNVTVPVKPQLTVSTPASDQSLITGSNLAAGTYFADLSNSGQLPITSVGFVLRESTGNFTILIQNITRPTSITPLEKQYGLETPYQYVSVIVIGIDPEKPFRTINVEFRVSKKWMEDNGIDPATVTLYRYDNGWRPLVTVGSGENTDYRNYHVGDARAFSYYVISAKKLLGAPSLTLPPYMVEPMTYAQLAIMLVLILLLLIVAFKRRRRPLALE